MKIKLSWFRLSALFLLSVTLLAYELGIMRLFAVGSWDNFGSMVISICLLGFGLAGTLLTLIQKRILANPDRWLFVTAFLLGPTMALSQILGQQVPFNPVLLPSNPAQLWWIAAYYVIYAVPFFFGALFIGVIFMSLSSRIHQLYFWNMVGSGVGGFVILLLMFVLPPSKLILPLLALASLTAVGCAFGWDARSGKLSLGIGKTILTALLFVASFAAVDAWGGIRVSQFKPISYARNFPDVRQVYHHYSPTGDMYVYDSSYFHFAPGLSDNASLNLTTMPKDAFLGLYIDGDGPIGVMRKLHRNEEKYIDYLPMSAPYLLLHDPKVLLLKLGGAISVFTALYHHADRVDVVEPNPDLIHMLRDVPFFKRFTGDVLANPRVHVYNTEPRAYTASTTRRYDLVEISLIDSVGLSQAGGYPIKEDYIYTVQGIDDYLRSLNKDGMLSITVWNTIDPPENVPKLLSTVVEALKREGVKDPQKRIFTFDLLLSTATILVKNSAFTPHDIAVLRDYCNRMSFNVDYYPGQPNPPGKNFTEILNGYQRLYGVARGPAAGPAAGALSPGQGAAGAVADSGNLAKMLAQNVRDAEASGATGASVAGQAPSTAAGAPKKGRAAAPPVAGRLALPSSENDLLGSPDVPSRDLSKLSGEQLAEALIPSDLYHFSLEWLLHHKAQELYKKYIFDIRPATDNRPYYTTYLKPSNIGAMARHIGQIPEVWGQLLLFGTLLQSIIFGLLIVVIPMAGGWRAIFRRRRGTLGVILYYGALGLGYMMAEIYLMQRFNFYLADPVYSSSIVLTTMLIASGLGAIVSNRFPLSRSARVWIAAGGIALFMVFYIFGLSPLMNATLGLSLIVKILFSVIFIAPAAFCLGIPFPTGLDSLSANRKSLLPWAWGMNGALAVTGSVLTRIISISTGFVVVLLCVIAIYLIVALVFKTNEIADEVEVPTR